MTIDELKDILEAGFQGTHARLDALNGRTRQNELDLAILKDRAERGGWLGALTGGTLAGVVVGIKAWLDR